MHWIVFKYWALSAGFKYQTLIDKPWSLNFTSIKDYTPGIGQSVMINLHQICVHESEFHQIREHKAAAACGTLEQQQCVSSSSHQLTRPDPPLVQQQHQSRRPDNRLHTGCPGRQQHHSRSSSAPHDVFTIPVQHTTVRLSPLWQQQQSRSAHRG